MQYSEQQGASSVDSNQQKGGNGNANGNNNGSGRRGGGRGKGGEGGRGGKGGNRDKSDPERFQRRLEKMCAHLEGLAKVGHLFINFRNSVAGFAQAYSRPFKFLS